MPSLAITEDFGYVILVIGISWIMNFYLVFLVIAARKKYGVEYPTLYAESSHKNAEKFNSAQRAHQNTLENWAPVQILMLVNGLVYPQAAACCGLIWVLGRFVYGFGYAYAGPKGRMAGGLLSHVGDFPLILMTFYTGAKMAKLL
uniref:Glutathione S-transferase 3, mitochondrial n=1 Tax=Eutreptiella gymnastica TaxID=73025 RepID=A0A7S1NDF5_9EUGL